jgi:hypothetical protein
MPAKDLPRWSIFLVFGLWVGTYFAARYALSLLPPDSGARPVVAIVPVIPTLIVLWILHGVIGRLDELQRRVHLEATVIAFTLTIALLWVLGLLELAVELDRDDWSYRHVWAFMPAFYFIGLAVSWRRYK